MTSDLIEFHDDRPNTCKRCGHEIWGVEYDYTHPERYDGISEWWCNPETGGCGLRVGRWSGKVLKEEECEKRLGGVK